MRTGVRRSRIGIRPGCLGATMSQPTPDPTRWLTELMSTEHVMWPGLDIADTTKAMAAAAAPWTKAVADITALQLEALKTLAAPWTVADARRHARGRADQGPALRRRGVDEGPALRGRRPDLPRADRPACARRSTPRRSTSAARRSGGSRCSQVMDALSPANTLATNPEALQLAMETGGASLVGGHAAVHRGPGQGPDRDDRRDGVRGGPQRRHDAGHRRLPERADPADPVHADDRPRSTSGRW